MAETLSASGPQALDPWPFATVPDSDRAAKWAGREEDRDRLSALVSGWQRRRSSEIDVIWADFGQGKTHSLLHLSHLCSERLPEAIIHYVQLPPLTTGSPFVALYKQLLTEFPLDVIARRVFDNFSNNPTAVNRDTPSGRHVFQLLWLIGTKAPGAELARRWFHGDRISTSAWSGVAIAGRPLSVPPAPTSAQDCQNMLDTLIGLINDFPARGAGQSVLLIDEFQRLGELPPRKRVEVCSALHLVFNRHPQGLRLVLAFAGGMPEIVSSVLTPDLQSRLYARMTIPPMTLPEGRDYVARLLTAYRVEPRDGSDGTTVTSPFADDAVEFLLRRAEVPGVGLSPRRINIVFDLTTNAVLDSREAGGRNQTDDITKVDVEEAWRRVENEVKAALAPTGAPP